MPETAANRAKAIVDAAAVGGYAVPAVCVYNLEGILATIRALTALRSPGLILLFPWAQSYSGLALATVAAHCARSAPVPVAVHLDHATDPAAIRAAADSGLYDGIMVDMSHHSTDENLARTRELVAYCRARGVATEAEPGRIEGGEDGVTDTGALEALMTDAAQARRFVDTGIDWLAPAFGNVHGSYGRRGIRLDYDRLAKVHEAVGREVRLVLHGTDGFDRNILQECIERGIVKVNINKSVNNVWKEVVKGEGPLTSLMEKATNGMEAEVKWWIRMLASEGKAATAS